MMVEFFEDHYLNRPEENRESGAPFVTGDPLIDKWEQEIAHGLTPDLAEGLDPQESEIISSWSRESMRRKQDRLAFAEEISETY